MAGVLNDIKVLDLSWGISGPLVGMLLGDHGADVTRIERPQGDPFKGMLGYKVWHRGKKNAIFDLKNKEDLRLFKKLVADADVLIESMTPGKMKNLGLSYDELSILNPRLIYCSISAFGDDDPRSAYDAEVAAESGLQWEQRGWPEGALNHITGREDPFAGAIDINLIYCKAPTGMGHCILLRNGQVWVLFFLHLQVFQQLYLRVKKLVRGKE